MIYKSSYFNKELRQAYKEKKDSAGKKAAFAFFLGLISFSFHFTLQTLRESVLIDIVPEIMQSSYFSTIYIYIHASVILIAFYFIFYYDSIFFCEIRKNSWYLLAKMGYNPMVMIFSKLAAILLSTTFVYTVGFSVTLFLTFFLRYNLVTAYFPALYLAGLIDLIVISTISMMLSSFINTPAYARFSILFSVILLLLLKYKTHFYHILSNRVIMQNIYNMFDLHRSSFLPIAGAIILICVSICITKARNISKYYNLSYDNYDNILPTDVPVLLVNFTTGQKKPLFDRTMRERYRKFFDIAFTSSLILFISAALSFNIMILFISASTTGKEVSIHGVIPYIFKSNTMEPTIMPNDLAYFKKIDGDHEINTGEIVLFEENNITYVERVVGKDKGIYQVDIDKYPPKSEPGAMKKSVKKESIHGLYSGRNRWLGVLILFANTIIGKLVLLLIPTFLLFYHKPITDKIFQKNK
ncbi:MAG: S26 family signal peptidase [Firmicutes bacterium]|nr:S26 family signal peptidase [Bacillota bacterium]